MIENGTGRIYGLRFVQHRQGMYFQSVVDIGMTLPCILVQMLAVAGFSPIDLWDWIEIVKPRQIVGNSAHHL